MVKKFLIYYWHKKPMLLVYTLVNTIMYKCTKVIVYQDSRQQGNFSALVLVIWQTFLNAQSVFTHVYGYVQTIDTSSCSHIKQ